MSKSVFIAEKPSVAQEFAKALHVRFQRNDGYLESDQYIVTWCVGHLVTMSYPEVYDEKYKKWNLSDLPFIPQEFKYEVISGVKKQFAVVKKLLNRKDVSRIYVCTDSGREGEYIYRLVEQMANVKGKERRRVWIDSQTEEEIRRGIREAKDLAEYDNLAASAYLRAKEDYLMGINFSRLLTLKYGRMVSGFMNTKYTVISVGRVMTCVLGMVVRREREIREFVKTPFFRVLQTINLDGNPFEFEWKAVKGSLYFDSPKLYKENGFKFRKDAESLVDSLNKAGDSCKVVSVDKKTEKKGSPLLYNLAELQGDCSAKLKISPDETLKIAQELYEKKLVTYPRTDARVLSTPVAKEIHKNLNGLMKYPAAVPFLNDIKRFGSYKGLDRSRFVDDKKITDHYALIPTGQGLDVLESLSPLSKQVYDMITRRFLAIFYPPAVYNAFSIVTQMGKEQFFANYKLLTEEGFLKLLHPEKSKDLKMYESLSKFENNAVYKVESLDIKEGETTPPKRYTSGSMILAMENAGQLIEDENLRAQIKGAGIGTSATRSEILKKLCSNKYLSLNKKTQIISPTLLGETVYDVVDCSMRQLLNPELTASWEKGLNYVAEGSVTSKEYMDKLSSFIMKRFSEVMSVNNQEQLRAKYNNVVPFYSKASAKKAS